jgi:hypothetical protein
VARQYRVTNSSCTQRRVESGQESKRAILKYFAANPGTLFIIAFLILLGSAAVILIEGNSVLANGIAIYAFIGLIVGVAIQVGMSFKEESNHTPASSNDDSPSS